MNIYQLSVWEDVKRLYGAGAANRNAELTQVAPGNFNDFEEVSFPSSVPTEQLFSA
jgi:hypothetical protein